MNLQLDTTVSFHKTLKRFDDPIFELYKGIQEEADSVHASTFTKKEFAFSLISDLCGLQAHIISKGSFVEAYRWLERYGCFRKRFGGRMREMLAYFVVDRFGAEILDYDLATKDKILSQRLLEYLRIIIPEFWERFDEDLDLPLDDGAECPFAGTGPQEENNVFKIRRKTSRHPCDGSEGCAIAALLSNENVKDKGISLLAELRSMVDDDPSKTDELKKIEDFLGRFYEEDEHDLCYEMCNSGIGDLIIAMETLPTRTLITTNSKEFSLICPVIHPEWRLLSEDTAH